MDRRAFLLTAAFAVSAFSPAMAQSPIPPAHIQTPEAIVRWIYIQATNRDKDGQQNGGTIFGKGGPSVRLFSSAFMREWNAAQARLKKSGDMGLDFDPVSNSQDPAIGKTDIRLESKSEDRTTIAVTFGSLHDPRAKPQTVRYDFVRTEAGWKIDNIRGAVENDPWSLRALMKEWK